MASSKPIQFVPLLYFMQAVPYFVVTELTEIIYKDLKVENAQITFWTSLIAIPWTIKLLWAPLVDLNSTKRNWSLSLQWAIAVCLALSAFAMKLPNPFAVTLAIFTVTAIFSSTCDIATDGYYLLALNGEERKTYVGMQSAFFKVGRVFVQGLIVSLSGVLQKQGWSIESSWFAVLLLTATVYVTGRVVTGTVAPHSEEDVERSQTKDENYQNIFRALYSLGFGLAVYFFCNSIVRLGAHSLWGVLDGTATGRFHGWMLTADQMKIEVGQLILCGLGTSLLWMQIKRKMVGTEMGRNFGSFLRQPNLIGILLFLTLYRFTEAMVGRIAPLFLKDAPTAGGLAINNLDLGQITGTTGVVGIIVGGILGGYVIGKFGMKKALWPVAILMHLPHLGYIWASFAHPGVAPMHGVAFMEMFGYGFGFAAYFIVLQSVAQRDPEYQTSHYAIGTGLGSLCISVAGIAAGIIQSNFGYSTFFISALALSVPGVLTLLLLPRKVLFGTA